MFLSRPWRWRYCILLMFPISDGIAQWQLIDDFREIEIDTKVEDGQNIGWFSVASDEYSIFVLENPYDYEAVSHYISVQPSGIKRESRVFLSKHLPGNGIEPEKVGTIFFKAISGTGMDWEVGVTDVQEERNPQTGEPVRPGTVTDFNSSFGYNSGEGCIFHRDFGEIVNTRPQYIIMEHNGWFDFYLVVSNTFSGNSSTGSFKLYVRNQGEHNASLVKVGKLPVSKESASFSRSPLSDQGSPRAITSVMLTMTHKSPNIGIEGVYVIGDIYFSTGENLSNPIKFSGCLVDGERDTDTGDWLGWLNLVHAPHIWSYTLNGWIYMEQPEEEATGAWGYFFK